MMKITPIANLLAAATLSFSLGCGGSERSRDPGTSSQRDAGSTQSRDAGVDPRDDPNLTEYGTGRYAILLSDPDPRRYCWYVETTVRICGGSSPSQEESYQDICYDDETNCLARQPEDTETNTGQCIVRVRHRNVSGGALYGDCGRVDAYFSNDRATQCLYHAQCPDDRLCVDYQCVCTAAECGCLTGCPPLQPPRCEGDVVVAYRIGEGCDENDACIVLEERTDCAASGAVCDDGACVGGGGVDAGVEDGGEGPPDTGPGGPDAGPANPDAGCECPPTAPPNCVGQVSETYVCDPVTCQVSTVTADCAARGQICEPTSGVCIDGECIEAADCPPPGPTQPGFCEEVRCEDNQCVSEVNPC